MDDQILAQVCEQCMILTKWEFSVGNWRKFAFKGKQQFTEATGVAISDNSKT